MNRTAEQKLMDPIPGGFIAGARDYGIDLSQIVENLRLTPAERIKHNDDAVNSIRKLEEAMSRAKAIAKAKRNV